MVLTHDEELASRMKILSLHGISKNAWNRYSGSRTLGLRGAGVRLQVQHERHSVFHWDSPTEKAGRVHRGPRRGSRSCTTTCWRTSQKWNCRPSKADCRHAWHLYTLRLNLDRLAIGRDEFIEQLKERGVGTSVHFIPIPLHPFFASRAKLRQNQCPTRPGTLSPLDFTAPFSGHDGGAGRVRGASCPRRLRASRARRIGPSSPRRATSSRTSKKWWTTKMKPAGIVSSFLPDCACA